MLETESAAVVTPESESSDSKCSFSVLTAAAEELSVTLSAAKVFGTFTKKAETVL